MPSVAQSYEAEQQNLHRQHDGAVDDEDLNIEIPRAPEVNPEVYRDVEPLLFRGFLHVPAEINGIPFVFKSLNHHEFELLNFYTGTETKKGLRKYYSLFLAYGVFMVDGVNVLTDRNQYLPELSETFKQFDENLRSRIVRHMSEVNRRANRAVILSEAYAMENSSRLRWAQMQGIDLTSTAITGIEGTSAVGMNWGQLTWRALNHYEDVRDQAERDWENAKFVASAMAGKGMSKIHSHDKQRRKKEVEDRLERKDKILRFAVLGEPLDKSKGSAPIQVARTVEELQDQLERDLRGEKDWHDEVVEAHEMRVREQFQARQEHLQELHRSFEEKYGDRALVSETDSQGLTPDEVKFRLARRRQLAAQRLSAQQSYPELHDPKMSHFIDKYVRNPTDSPPVVVSTRPRGTPFGKGR